MLGWVEYITLNSIMYLPAKKNIILNSIIYQPGQKHYFIFNNVSYVAMRSLSNKYGRRGGLEETLKDLQLICCLVHMYLTDLCLLPS